MPTKLFIALCPQYHLAQAHLTLCEARPQSTAGDQDRDLRQVIPALVLTQPTPLGSGRVLTPQRGLFSHKGAAFLGSRALARTARPSPACQELVAAQAADSSDLAQRSGKA